MSEPVPAAIITTVILLLTAFAFFALINVWNEHSVGLNQAVVLQEHRLATSLDIQQVMLSEDACPNYSGPFEALVVNNGATAFTDLGWMDVLVDYRDAGDARIAGRLQQGPGWWLEGIEPDDRNPGHWDPGETATINFALDPGIQADSWGVFLISSPQGFTHSRYFTCPVVCNGLTGFLNPTAEAADGGDGFEVDPQNAFFDDGNAASSAETGGPSQNSHRYYNYGISLHPSCQVNGIEVRLDWWVELATPNRNSSMSVDLSWDGGNSWTASKLDQNESTVPRTVILGGETDTWGRTWSPEELNDANFRVRVHTHRTVPQTFYLGWVPVNVYFGPP